MTLMLALRDSMAPGGFVDKGWKGCKATRIVAAKL